jgi:hypothetical protein
VPPVFHRSPPARTDRTSSESLRVMETLSMKLVQKLGLVKAPRDFPHRCGRRVVEAWRGFECVQQGR